MLRYSPMTMKEIISEYLEQELCFRDYRILPAKYYGKVSKVGIHYRIINEDQNDYAWLVDDAVDMFCRDGFSMIYFYV